MALTGTFDDIGFAELLQLLHVGHRSGRLQVWRDAERAEILIRDGEVFRATSRLERGPEVVYRVMGWRRGEFSFERGDGLWEREIAEGTEALILEGMKRFDEWARVETECPEMSVVLRQRASAVSNRYEMLSDHAQRVLRLVDAHRDVATLIRESGLTPQDARQAVTELLVEGMVEEWEPSKDPQQVLRARDRLPETQGGIDISVRSVGSDKR